MSRVTRSKLGDKLYYNIRINYSLANRVNNECLGAVQYQSEQAILDKANDWYASVVSFSVPLSTVPLLFGVPQNYPNTDPNLMWWSIAIAYNGVIYRKAVTFKRQDYRYTEPSPPTVTNQKIERTLYYGIWSYSALVEMINTAITDLQAEILIADPGYPTPSLTIEFLQDGSNTYQIIADYAEFGFGGGSQFYFDEHLLQFFQGFTYKYNAPIGGGPGWPVWPNPAAALDEQGLIRKWNKVEFLETSTNIVDGKFYLKQDFPVMANTPSMRSIQLRSDQLGINAEWTPSGGASSDGTPSYQRVLAEFTPQYTDTVGASIPRSGITYSLNSSWRLISILDAGDLRGISLAVFWLDEEGNAFRITLNPRESIAIKLCFHLRDTYRG